MAEATSDATAITTAIRNYWTKKKVGKQVLDEIVLKDTLGAPSRQRRTWPTRCLARPRGQADRRNRNRHNHGWCFAAARAGLQEGPERRGRVPAAGHPRRSAAQK